MQTPTPIAAVILCAGKGRRMRAPKTPKVCFPVAGKPAILHLLENLQELAVDPTVLVVGHLAGAVVDEVGPRFPSALYAYQAELLGTGHAARQGAEVLRRLRFQGGIFVVAGDKLVEPRALKKLLHTFETESPDLALMVAPKDRWPDAGRILCDEEGNLQRILERADLDHAREAGASINVDGRALSADEIEASVQWVNQAVYLFRAEALFEALDQLGRDNIQKEEYLTDALEHLVRTKHRVLPVPVDAPDDVLGFNSPTELLEIEEHFRRKMGVEITERVALDPRIFKPPAEWAACLSSSDPSVTHMLQGIYGKDEALCEEKRNRLRKTVELFIDRFGSEGQIAVIRAPGRVNLMGRHVDHRGGCVNLMAIDREHILVARRREDTTVHARNADVDTFEDIEFSVDDLLQLVRLDDWRNFVDSETVVQMVRDVQGNWGNYLKAPMLRLQQEFRDRQIRGLDCVVSGDIPMAAGLSSSSALVVAMAEALVLTNQLDVSPYDLVDLCGEGEWFVGTRGGSADHAAVKLSQPGQIAHVGFFPFSIIDNLPFPKAYALIVANSRIQARKAAGARNAFNERVASYEFAVHMVRKRFLNYAPLIHHLRDISPEGLGVRSADIYRILLDIPERATPEQVQAELDREVYERIAMSHEPPEFYELRARLLFGIAECERSRQCIKYLRDNDMERFGTLMRISHDGDRVVTPEGDSFTFPVTEAFIQQRIEDLQSEDPERVLAGQLYFQPGAYACSIPQIDKMVDIACAVPGVVGAQLSGAGLGGCMMVLARREATDEVISRMNELYYEPNGFAPGASTFVPVAGCSPLLLDS